MPETVLTCPCGQDHSASPAYPAVKHFVASKGETMEVQTPEGRWRVPRMWVAFHGIAEVDLSALAKRYRWEEVPLG